MAYTDYNFDPTAEAPANLISQEVHALDMATFVGVIPDQGAFFEKGLVVEARASSSDPWVELTPYFDFVFSPPFVDAGARTTRKQVFSYIVLNEDRGVYSDVRLTYQAIGKYRDSEMFTLLNAATFDRSLSAEWVAFSSYIDTMSHVTREETLVGKGTLEVLAAMVDKWTEAIQNPHAQGKNLGQDVARLEQKVAKALTTDAYAELTAQNDFSQAVVSGTAYEVKVTDDEVELHKGMLLIKSSTGDAYSVDVLGRKAGSTVHSALFSQSHNNGVLGTVAVTRSSDAIVIRVTPSVAGTMYYKTVSEIRG
ncbi:hypothetical protein [Vibrio phage vB_VmeM-Yong XC32]|nr:hypothetical protein [Vibrio phage vB_VmeM-Yong XC31]QAX96477.1 hypothetical protein [Vibrio phage vB_VmeM-Yong XC32]QAX96794.1 hypothetical protein [Vibrio phage vB_VmeM-Yong MS31]QAX97113.1 hypothetical protein [Vibrio phage vB_VmeM-Yong MS32]